MEGAQYWHVDEGPPEWQGLLRSVEDIFDLPHLGYAAVPGLGPFGSDVYTRREGQR